MQHLHNIRRTSAALVLWFGMDYAECQNEVHNGEPNRYRGTYGLHEHCLTHQYADTLQEWRDQGLRNDRFYCECHVCAAQTRGTEAGLNHIYLIQRIAHEGLGTFTFDQGNAPDYPEIWGRRTRYVCNDCREGIHARDLFPNLPVHEHEYDNWGGCYCGHYNAIEDQGGVDPDHTHNYDRDGYCITCDNYDPLRDHNSPDYEG